MSGLGTFLVALAGPVVRKALVSLGVGVVSYAAITAALNAALDAAKTSLNGFTGDASMIVAKSGVFVAMGIVAGALVARVSLMALKKLEILK